MKRSGRRGSSERRVSFRGEGFDNDGVRKAVLLARYGRLMKDCSRHEWTEARGENTNTDDGLGRWKRRSGKLVVSEEYHDRIEESSSTSSAKWIHSVTRTSQRRQR